MPLALNYSEGLLTQEKAANVGKQITDAFLSTHGLAGNAVMTPNVTMQIQALPRLGALSGGEPAEGVWLECKTPSFALVDRDVQRAFFTEATDIIETAIDGKLPRSKIYTNAVHAVDGTWNIDGRPLTNDEIKSEIARG